MSNEHDLWYIDCYCHDRHGAVEQFPANPYGPAPLEAIFKVILDTLGRPISGIGEVRIRRTTEADLRPVMKKIEELEKALKDVFESDSRLPVIGNGIKLANS